MFVKIGECWRGKQLMVPRDNVRDFREVAEGGLGVLPASIADDSLVVHHLGPFKTATCGDIGRQRSSVCQQGEMQMRE